MKIAIFTDSFLPYASGVTFAVINQAEQLVARGHQVLIVRPKPWSRVDRQCDLPDGVEVCDSILGLPAPGVDKLSLTLPTFLAATWKLKKWEADLVHLNTEWGTGWEGLMAAKRLGLPTVGTFHTFFADPGYLKSFGLPNLWLLRTLLWRYSSFFFSCCDRITAPSAAVRDALLDKGVSPEPMIVSNGMPPARLIAAEEIRQYREQHDLLGPTLVYVGRMSPEKSLDVVLQAFRQVADHRRDARLLMVGDGPSTTGLQTLAESLGLNDAVVWLGHVDHERLLRENIPMWGDAFVTASKTENQPLSVMEAMSFSLPVIAANARGLPELVTHGESGLLFPPDDVDALAGQMREILDRPDYCRQLGAGALASLARHGIEHSVDELEKVYRHAVQLRRAQQLDRHVVPEAVSESHHVRQVRDRAN